MSQGSQKMLVSLFGLHLIQTILRIGTPRFWHFRVNPEVPSAQCWNRKLKKTYHVQAFSSKALNESRFFILSQNVIFFVFFCLVRASLKRHLLLALQNFGTFDWILKFCLHTFGIQHWNASCHISAKPRWIWIYFVMLLGTPKEV